LFARFFEEGTGSRCGYSGVKAVDEFFAVIGVLFVIVLVAQVFQKPEKRTRRRANRTTKEVNRAGHRVRANRPPAGFRWRVNHHPVLRAGNRIYRWCGKPLARGEATVAGYITVGIVSIAVLVYLTYSLLHPETFQGGKTILDSAGIR
jgi:hypothetical protein